MTIQPRSLNVEITKKVQIDYLISHPEGYDDSTHEWGLIIFLHGMDKKGEDVSQLSIYGLLEIVNEGKDIVWEDMEFGI